MTPAGFVFLCSGGNGTLRTISWSLTDLSRCHNQLFLQLDMSTW